MLLVYRLKFYFCLWLLGALVRKDLGFIGKNYPGVYSRGVFSDKFQ